MTTTSSAPATRKPCECVGPDGYPCGIVIELRQGPNPALPPGWFEVASGHPHSCRRVCPSCHRPVGGPDRHALGCEGYERLLARAAEFRARRTA